VRYFVTLNPEHGADTVVVDVVERADGSPEARVDGRPVEVDVVSLPGHSSVRVAGRMVDLTVDPAPSGVGASSGGPRVLAVVESERTRATDREAERGGDPAAARGGGAVVRSPMPGRVVRVLVAPGDPVQAGQGVAVLEAMKMENEVRARSAGTVTEVHVAAGAAVDANAKLVTLAKV
jgi:glutaconyl-CoA/methylmalonyl-CoA decarboxylase subunit gamma